MGTLRYAASTADSSFVILGIITRHTIVCNSIKFAVYFFFSIYSLGLRIALKLRLRNSQVAHRMKITFQRYLIVYDQSV